MWPTEEINLPSEEAKDVGQKLRYLFYGHLSMILLCLTGQSGYLFVEIISGLWLFCLYKSANFHRLLFYIFLSFMVELEVTLTIAIYIQNGSIGTKGWFQVILCLFHGIGLYICLLAYREYKGLASEGLIPSINFLYFL